MSTLRNLKILSIQSNRIVKLEGLDELENLEELYISHNGIKKLEGLDKNVSLPTFRICSISEKLTDGIKQTKLRVLDIGNNFIQDIENVSHLTAIEEFWVSRLLPLVRQPS